MSLLKEFRPIGGSGSVVPGSPELKIAPLLFGSNNTLIGGPNPRTISNVISGGTGANGQNGQTTDPSLSAWLYVFGQFVDHDLDLEHSSPTSQAINIVVPPGDPNFPSGTTIPMTRDTRNSSTNTIVNTTAGYLDLSQLYGSNATTAASLSNSDGTLQSSGNGQYLPVVNGQFVTGDPRVMENPELISVTTLFMREHNLWVHTLKGQHPTWTGSQLYNMARAITTAEYQNIVYTQYLPALIGSPMLPYVGFNSQINPQVTQEFSTAAFRVGHSQVSDTQEGLNNQGAVVFTESLAQSFSNTPATDESNGIDALLRSLGNEFSQASDVYAVSALRNLLIAGLVGGNVDEIDLIAIDIQRNRDVGVNTLNQTRKSLGLLPYASFAALTSDAALQKNLQQIYGSIDNVDLFIGGLAETHVPGATVGPTFKLIIADQFLRVMNGDPWFWKRQGFDAPTATMISQTTLTTLMERDTATTNLQPNLFIRAAFPVLN